MLNLELHITGMSCDHCARTAEAALTSLPGVSASVSFATGRATVSAGDGTPVERLLEAVRSKGYGAVLGDKAGDLRPAGGDSLHVAIIGSGSAAFACAIRAAENGARVTLIERSDVIGGTCVNVGCVPSKIMVRSAYIRHLAGNHPFDGLARSIPALERRMSVVQQQARVEELRQAKYQSILDANPNITLMTGEARFRDARTLVIRGADNREMAITPDSILIATGSSPALPPIPGLLDTPYWTTTDALVADRIPKSLVVLGGSASGLELGQAFSRLGAEVTIIEILPRLLAREDESVGEAVKTILQQEGMDILTGAEAKRVTYSDGLFQVELANRIIKADALMLASGRRPNTAELDLARCGIRTAGNGAIVVDDRLRTNIGHIYAAGDCTNMPQFVYVAASGGTRAAINMMGGDAPLDLSTTASVVFTDPQVATVGLNELQAKDLGIAAESRALPLENVPRALANFDTRGFVRLVAEKGTGRLLGAQIVAAEAGEIIQIAALALQNRMTTFQLAESLFPYLTMAEGLKLAAQTFTRDVSRLSCCAG